MNGILHSTLGPYITILQSHGMATAIPIPYPYKSKEKLVCVICCKEFKVKKGRGSHRRKVETVKSLKQFCENILVGEDKKLELEMDTGLLFESSVKGQNRGAGVRPGKRPRRRRGRKKGSGGNKKGKQGVGGDDDEVKLEVDEEEEDGVDDEEEDDDGEMPFQTNLEARLSQFLDNSDDNLTICGKCVEMMNAVTESRLSVKSVEERVEKLQMLLLREMGRLARKMEDVWEEFEKIEESMFSGDFKVMERNLDECYSRKEGGKPKVWGKISEEHTERRQEIWGFRGKICDVLSGLEKYGFEVRQKHVHIHKPIAKSKPKGKRGAAEIYQEGLPENIEVKIEVDIPIEEEPSSSYYLAESVVPPPSDVPQNGNRDDDIEEPMDLDEFNDNLTDEEDCDFDEVNENEVQDGEMRDASSSEEDKQEEEDSDEEDCYNPVHKASSHEAVFTQLDFHLGKMSAFKCNLVKSVIKIQHWYQTKKKALKKPPPSLNPEDPKPAPPPPPPTPYRQHMSQLSYHLERKLIYLSGIPIKILCKAETPTLEENGILCTKCNFKAPESPDMATKMYDHIISKHLNAYQCPHCEDNYMETDLEWRNHVKTCRQGETKKVQKVDCEICGKTLCDKSKLEKHKWLHMNEEERREAIESGLFKKDPTAIKRNVRPKLHQCQKCGKGFPFKAELEKHEETHRDRSEREQFMCPKCGKTFLKLGLDYHRKYSDTCAEEPVKPVTCGVCGGTVKNKYILRRHMSLVHGEKSRQRPFVCGTCGKGFKERRGLMVHEIIHRGDKPFKCKVCGTGFSHSGNMRRHASKCGK